MLMIFFGFYNKLLTLTNDTRYSRSGDRRNNNWLLQLIVEMSESIQEAIYYNTNFLTIFITYNYAVYTAYMYM